MNNVLSSDAITLKKGANIKIREWYLKNVNTNNKLFVPSLNNVISVPYVKEGSKEEVMKLWIQHLFFKMRIENLRKQNW